MAELAKAKDAARQYATKYKTTLRQHSSSELDELIKKRADIFKKADKYFLKTGPTTTKEIIPSDKLDDQLNQIYNDPTTGLKSKLKFNKYIQDNYAGVGRQAVNQFLEKNEVYQRHRPASTSVKTVKPITAKRPFERLQIDLIDMTSLARYNKGYKWILTAIDVFTKKAYAKTSKTKDAAEIARLLKVILDDIQATGFGSVSVVQSDNGKEFLGEVSDLLTARGIKQVFSRPYTPQSQGQIEKFNGTLKAMIARLFTLNNSKKWLGHLHDLIENYNNTHHLTIKTTPDLAETSLPKQIKKIKKRLDNFAQKSLSADLFKRDLKIGDRVRVSLLTKQDLNKNKLSKRNLNPKWSKQIYIITKILDDHAEQTRKNPPKYKLKAAGAAGHGESISGLFYRNRLLKTDPHQLTTTEQKDNDLELNRADPNNAELNNADQEQPQQQQQPQAQQPKQRPKRAAAVAGQIRRQAAQALE